MAKALELCSVSTGAETNEPLWTRKERYERARESVSYSEEKERCGKGKLKDGKLRKRKEKIYNKECKRLRE